MRISFAYLLINEQKHNDNFFLVTQSCTEKTQSNTEVIGINSVLICDFSVILSVTKMTTFTPQLKRGRK